MGQKGQQSLVTDRRGIAGRTAGLWRFGDRDGLGRGGGKGRVRHGWHGDKSSWGLLGWEGQVSGTSRALNYVFSLNFRGGLLLSSLSSSWRVLGFSEFWGPYMKGYKSFHGGASDISHKSQGRGTPKPVRHTVGICVPTWRNKSVLLQGLPRRFGGEKAGLGRWGAGPLKGRTYRKDFMSKPRFRICPTTWSQLPGLERLRPPAARYLEPAEVPCRA